MSSRGDTASGSGAQLDPASLAASIDSTLLSPTTGLAAAAAWLAQQRPQGFAAVVVAPFVVPLAAELMAGGSTAVCSVAGFPLGYAATESKAEEARRLVELGCREVDVVMNVAAFLEGEHDLVRGDVAAVVMAVTAASSGLGLVKVILETGYLAERDVPVACRLAEEAGAAFVKTSTGFGPRGAGVADVRAMREAVGRRLGVKAAGGIRDLSSALAMIEAGADRLGTSAATSILEEARAQAGRT
ncbi:MAG: deoxyribose-phosphate aldolase [Coriobacteriia bacterium]|nr:deoxyribose-phosphate aldolase [Coriobacteriia bacterium]